MDTSTLSPNPTHTQTEFEEYTSGVMGRCVEPPVQVAPQEIGSYNLFGKSIQLAGKA